MKISVHVYVFTTLKIFLSRNMNVKFLDNVENLTLMWNC